MANELDVYRFSFDLSVSPINKIGTLHPYCEPGCHESFLAHGVYSTVTHEMAQDILKHVIPLTLVSRSADELSVPFKISGNFFLIVTSNSHFYILIFNSIPILCKKKLDFSENSQTGSFFVQFWNPQFGGDA